MLKLVSVIALSSVLLSCERASLDPGLDALLRVRSAQYVARALPEPNGGPNVESARVPHQRVLIGSVSEHVTGHLAPSATAVLLGLKGDASHWVVLAGVPTAEEPELPSFEAELSLSRALAPGSLSLQLSAADARGRIGARTTIELEASDLSDQAALLVRLRWDNDADLDLHVRDPEGRLIWSRDINSLRTPGEHSDRAGVLDFDSNASCSADGRSEERVVWREAHPSGRYQVRVATAALCGETAAHWSVDVRRNGRALAAASGIALATDARSGAGSNAGILALSFDTP